MEKQESKYDTLTLTDICDKFGIDLTIKRYPINKYSKNCNKPEYFLGLKQIKLYDNEENSGGFGGKVARVTGTNINTMLKTLCEKMSNKYIFGYSNGFFVNKVIYGQFWNELTSVQNEDK